MCMGGGNNAAKAAAATEAQRESQIGQNVGAINSAFTGRTGQYSDYAAALKQQYQTELNRQQGVAGRNLKFALARNGVTGGSTAADQGQLLGDEFAKGTLTAQQQVQSATAGLQAKDEQTRQQMIALAESGSNIGNAASQTASALQANIGNAQAVNVEQGLGDVFGDVTKNITSAQNAAQLRRGIQTGNQYAQPFSRSQGAP